MDSIERIDFPNGEALMNFQKKIILISGKQGSGKSSLSTSLKHAFWSEGVSTVQEKFAMPLYEMQSAVYSCLKQYGVKEPEKDGELLQLLGTEWARKKFGVIFWASLLEIRVKMFSQDHPHFLYLVDDTRFESEFDAFPYACRIRLECARDIRKARCTYWREKEFHESEIGLDVYSSTGKFNLILNTETDSMEHNVKKVLDYYKEFAFA